MTAHALLSASSSARWLHCTPSPRLEEDYVDSSSIFAAEGTLAHELAELGLNRATEHITKRAYTTALKKLQKSELYYEGMLDQVQEYVDLVIEKLNEAKAVDPLAELLIEARLDFSEYAPDGFGTGDAVIVANGVLEVIDLKFGKGVEVSAEMNSQLMLYGLGALHELGFMYDVDTVRLTIAQVRLNNFSTFEISVADLLEWGEELVKPQAALAHAGEGNFVVGPWCRFCKARNDCKARAEEMLKDFDDYEDTEKLTLEDIAQILEKVDDIEKWAKEIKQSALDKAVRGEHIPGWKLVEGRSNRIITDEAALASRLLDNDYKDEEIYKPKTLQTLTALEKLVGKKDFSKIAEGLIDKPQGKPTLAPESDKRPAIEGAEADFEFN